MSKREANRLNIPNWRFGDGEDEIPQSAATLRVLRKEKAKEKRERRCFESLKTDKVNGET